jgi:iron complex outermembrane receptor protein
MNRLLLSFLILLVSMVSYAQKTECGCFVKGVVKDQHSGQPIVGATVLILGQNSGVFTDENGRYELRNLCPGAYTLECRIVGYNSFQQKLDLTAGHEENFNLLEQEVHLHDVEITAHRTDAPSSQPLTTLRAVIWKKHAGNAREKV